VNFWTISIHDGDYRVPRLLEKIVNGAAHHTEHHLRFNCNYGQFFTLWDRIGGSYLRPSSIGEAKAKAVENKNQQGKAKEAARPAKQIENQPKQHKPKIQ
jgi:lathosterol oxidase